MRPAISVRQARAHERAALEALQWRASLNNPGDREALPHAERFYTACGFEVTGTEHTRFGMGLLMRRSIE